MPLSDADRAYLSSDWRWAENTDANVRTRHPGAREGEYGSCFMTVGGATAALNIIAAATNGSKRLIVGTIDGIPDVSFKSRPRTVRLYYGRFGGNKTTGQLFMVEGVNVDYGRRVTTLNLIG